ncbi:MAG: Rho termination factor N-terminal domain-containing protein [Acidimicrobiales bacterium]|nr:Rho termination factor N-terminal domain-containing protein [Acidimicrobiales bacterium]HRW39345.1 Rho termination factor N-terminal domain-containing protein [Aquihabitans sp.]
MPEPVRFPFAFAPAFRWPARLVGVHEGTASVLVDAEHLDARFGPWRVTTPLANLAGAGLSGPYAVAKTIGPAHLSLADRGLTFATNAEAGVCLTFRDPVPGIDPFGWVRHRGLTVTVADPDALVQLLAEHGIARTDGAWVDEQQEAHDELHTMTASELRQLAKERGVAHASSARKADLVALLEEDLATHLPDELAS